MHLLLGHHAADQAETVAMRAVRGPGGGEGMPAWSARTRILILRPLLGLRPEVLRAFLRARGMGWIEDPSNSSEKFERVRLRKMGARAAPQNAAARVAREEQINVFLAAHAQFRPEGFVILDAVSAPAAVLGALIRMLGGAAYAPRQAALARLTQNFRPATLGGVRILPAGRLGPGWLLAREPAACAPAIPAMQGALWDGRFMLLDAPAPDQVFGALGADAKKFREYNHLPAIIRRTMPALRGPGGNIAFPVAASFRPSCPATSHPFTPWMPI